MDIAVMPANEAQRLRRLHDYRLLDTPPEAAFDAITRLAATICNTPIALISLVDDTRQWFKSRVGLDVTETPRGDAFCAHTILSEQILEVADASADARFRDNPLVHGAAHVRFYAGMPLSVDGCALGSLCVVDREPRRLTPDQRASLSQLAQVVVRLFEARREAVHGELLGRMLDATTSAILVFDPRTLRIVHSNAGAQRLTGYAAQTLLELTPAELLVAYDAPRLRAELDGLASGARLWVDVDTPCCRSGGTRFAAEGRLILWRTERAPLAVLVLDDVSRRKTIEQALRDSERRVRLVTDSVPAAIGYADQNERLWFANDVFLRLLGRDRDQAIGHSLRELFGADYGLRAEAIRDVLDGRRVAFERQVLLDGTPRTLETAYAPDVDEAGRVRGFYGLSYDVTERKRVEQALAESEQRLRMIADNLPALVCYIDADWRYRFNNAAYFSWLGWHIDELKGRHVAEAMSAERYALLRPQLERAFAGERVSFEVELRRDGAPCHLRGTYVPDIDGAGRVVGVYGLKHDVTGLKRVEQELRQLAQYDTLTGAANRRRCCERLEEAIARSRRDGAPLALLYLDIDRLKGINDGYGHRIGDAVLREVAQRLTECVRETDTVARLGGDEFGVILEQMQAPEDAAVVACKIRDALARPQHCGQVTLVVSASIGIALYGPHDADAESLLRRADAAMVATKVAVRDRSVVAERATTRT